MQIRSCFQSDVFALCRLLRRLESTLACCPQGNVALRDAMCPGGWWFKVDCQPMAKPKVQRIRQLVKTKVVQKYTQNGCQKLVCLRILQDWSLQKRKVFRFFCRACSLLEFLAVC